MKRISFIIMLMLVSPGFKINFTAAEKKLVTLDDVGVDVDHPDDDNNSHVQKRSGSADYVVHFKSGLLSSLGHASASLASSSSHGSGGIGGASGGGGYNYNPHGDGHHSNSVGYDPWSLKKSVWNTIFQAVKAITGGVTALKGQLIKGSGYALKASGHVVAASGDKVTDVGKYIINKAQSNLHPIPSGSGLPFNKFGSFSSSGHKYGAPPVVHTETISTYEYPTSGHTKLGPPSNLPSYSSVSQHYIPSSSGGSGGSAGYSHSNTAAFEAPYNSYLSTSYGIDGHDDFKVYRGSNQLNEQDSLKATQQLQEIVNLMPDETNAYTNSNNFAYDSQHQLEDVSAYDSGNHANAEQVLSATESIPSIHPEASHLENNYLLDSSADVYHQMQKQKLSPEEIYLSKHPDEAEEFKSHLDNTAVNYKHYNYHSSVDNASPELPATYTTNYSPFAGNTINKIRPVSKHLAQYQTQNSKGSKQYTLPSTTTKINYYIYRPVHSKYAPRIDLSKPKVSKATFKHPQRRYVNVEQEYKAYDFDHLSPILYGGVIDQF